jgi:hypothetical protein
MKSGVAFWRALRSVKEIHPCWSHLDGQPITEADLPRPISTKYRSIFDLPSTRTDAEQAAAIAKADAVPRTTLVTASGVAASGASLTTTTDAQKTVDLIRESMRQSKATVI